jgi:antitoxin (DNA-binding transcriptional repressor) of toxin-antitoxin stability system
MDDQPRSTAKKINAMRVRQSLGDLLNEVYYKGDTFIVERDGKPMAALVPLSVLEELRKNSGQADADHNVQKRNKRQAHKKKA